MIGNLPLHDRNEVPMISQWLPVIDELFPLVKYSELACIRHVFLKSALKEYN